MRPHAPLLAALLLVAGGARPDGVGGGHMGQDTGPDYDPGKAQRRSDFAAGLTFAPTIGTVSGYPNDAAQSRIAKYHDSTGTACGDTFTFWRGGALRDWPVVGIGFTGTTVGGSDTLSQGGAFAVHVEGFPLFYRGGAFCD